MGNGVSYKTREEAIADGKTSSEIDAYIAANGDGTAAPTAALTAAAKPVKWYLFFICGRKPVSVSFLQLYSVFSVAVLFALRLCCHCPHPPIRRIQTQQIQVVRRNSKFVEVEIDSESESEEESTETDAPDKEESTEKDAPGKEESAQKDAPDNTAKSKSDETQNAKEVQTSTRKKKKKQQKKKKKRKNRGKNAG